MDNIYNDCTIPLPLYIRASVHKDVTALFKVVPDEVTEEVQEQLADAWLSITSEFAELVGDATLAAYSAEMNRVTELRARLLWVSVAVESLRMHPSESIIEELRTEDFGLSLDPSDPVQFAADLDRVLIELIQDEIELEQLLDKQEKEAEPDIKRQPQTEAHYDEILLEISSKEGARYRASELTTREFALLLKRLKKHHKPTPQPEY